MSKVTETISRLDKFPLIVTFVLKAKNLGILGAATDSNVFSAKDEA